MSKNTNKPVQSTSGKIEIKTNINKDIAKNGLVSTAPPKPNKTDVKPTKK